MLYRILLAAYTLVTWYLSFINFNRVVVVDKYFIYLTNWSYILLTLQTIAAALIVVSKSSGLLRFILKLNSDWKNEGVCIYNMNVVL